MKTSKIIARNVAALTIGRFFSRVIQFFLFIYAARNLGAGSFGTFSFSNNLVYILWLVMDIGISRYSIQQMSKDAKTIPLYVGTSLVIKFFLVFFGYILITGAGILMQKDVVTIKSLLILSTAAAFDAFALSFSAVFNANEKMFYLASTAVASKSIMSIVGFLILYYSNSLLFFCGVITLGSFLQLAAIAFFYFLEYKKIEFNLEFNFIKNILKNSVPFSLSHIFTTIYYSIDSIMLDFLQGATIVGYYNAAYKIIDAPLFLSESVKHALFPTVSRLYTNKNEKDMINIISRAYDISLAAGLSIASIIAFLSEKIILVCYGLEYKPASTVLPILIFSIVFIMPSTICNAAIWAVGQQSRCVYVSGGGVILNIVLNLILIPKYSFLGAAWATLITEMVVAVIYIEITRRHIVYSILNFYSTVRIMLMPFLLIVFLYFTNSFTLWLQLVGCAILFLPFSLIIGIISVRELTNMFFIK